MKCSHGKGPFERCQACETGAVVGDHEYWLAQTWQMIALCATETDQRNRVSLSPSGCAALMAEKSCGAAQPATDTIATSPVASVLDRNRDERFVGKELVSSNLRSLRERVAALDVLEPGGRGWAVPASVFRDGVLDLIDEAIESAGETTGGPDKRDDELLHLRRQMGEIAVLLLQNDRDEVMEWARGVKLHFPDGAPELVAESPAETPARHMEKCTFGGSYGWCELELGHDGPHSIPKPVKSTGEPA